MEESLDPSDFRTRNRFSWSVPWPVLLLSHILLLLVQLCFSVYFFGYGLLYLLLVLTLSSLLNLTYQHYEYNLDEIRLSGWNIVLLLLLVGELPPL